MTEERLKHLEDISDFVYGKNVGAPKRGTMIHQDGKYYYIEKNEKGEITKQEELSLEEIGIINKMGQEKKEIAERADSQVQEERKQAKQAEDFAQKHEMTEAQREAAAKHDKGQQRLIRALIELVNADYAMVQYGSNATVLKTIRDYDRLLATLSELQTPGLSRQYMQQLQFGLNPRTGKNDPQRIIQELSDRVAENPELYQQKDEARARRAAEERAAERRGEYKGFSFLEKAKQKSKLKAVDKMEIIPGLSPIDAKAREYDQLFQEGNIIYEEVQPQILDNPENKALEESPQEVETHEITR